MRADMATVVTERPRAGGGVKTPKGSRRQLQRELRDGTERHREKIGRKWDKDYNNAKQFTDVLGPIRGYLLKQVGRPWDKVYSEIKKTLPDKGLSIQHILGHIYQFVERHVIMDGKVPCHGAGMLYGIPIRDDFYVNPLTGLLCKAKQSKQFRWWNPKPKIGIEVPNQPNQQYHKINGVWYVLTLAKRGKHKVKPNPDFRYMIMRWEAYDDDGYDVAHKCLMPDHERRRVYGSTDLLCTAKEQLSSKEIRKAKLDKAEAQEWEPEPPRKRYGSVAEMRRAMA